MRGCCFFFLGIFSLTIVACSDPTTTNPAPENTGDAAIAKTDSSIATQKDSSAKSNGADGSTPTDASPSGADSGPESQACIDYCKCYETKCAGFAAIPGGASCPDFCATFTSDQYTCRYDMCFYNSNGPAEDNNDHCEHTVGIDECL